MRFDESGPWDLEIEGFEVAEIDTTHSIRIVAHGPAQARAKIAIGGRFEFHAPDRSKRVIHEPDESNASLLAVLRSDTIRLLRITNESELRIEFASGYVITSSADENYESWEVHAPGKYTEILVVAPPGGGRPVIWDGETKPRRIKIVDGQTVDVTDG